MDPLVGSALIGVGANVLGNLFNVGSQRQANAANMELAKFQWEKNLEMWNMQNEYNLPVNQMKRLRAAGINPVMAFSGGQVSGNVAPNAPEYKAPQMQATQVDSSGLASIGSAYIQAKQSEKQMELMDTQAELNRAKVATENMVALLRELQGTKQWMDNQYFSDVAPILKETLEYNRDLISSKKRFSDLQGDNLDNELKLFPLKQNYIESQIKSLDASTRYTLLRSVGEEIENALEGALLPYADSMAYSKANILKQELLGHSKLNSLRDLKKVFMTLQNEQYPLEFRLKIFEAIIRGTTSVAPFLMY